MSHAIHNKFDKKNHLHPACKICGHSVNWRPSYESITKLGLDNEKEGTKTFKIMSLISKTFESELMNLGKVKEI